MIRQLNLLLVAISFLAASGCVSHRTVLNDPIPTLNRWDKLDATPLGACRELAPSKQESTTYEPSLVCKLLILGCRLLIPDRLLGTRINVHLKTGVIISSRFRGSTTSQLNVTTEGADQLIIAKSDVLEITSADADSLKNGALWSLGIGALGAFGGGLTQGAGAAVPAFVQALSFGLLLDWLHQEHEVIYIAP